MNISVPAPSRDFGSDNRSGVSPDALAAYGAANAAGRADSYGADDLSAAATAALCDLFGRQVFAVWVPTGTAANVAGIGALLDGPASCVLVADDAHVRLDEAGAVERVWGAPLVPVAPASGLLTGGHVAAVVDRLAANAPFSPVPAVLSVTELSETGRRHGMLALADLCETAAGFGMRVHVDGARFANALVADPELAALFDAGVSTLAFGGTKNGQGPVEAVVTADAAVHARVFRAAKQLGYVQSKGRFTVAGIAASLRSGEYLANARAANARAAQLGRLLADGGLVPVLPVDGNLVFVRVPADRAATIDAWCHVSQWDDRGLLRLACSWDHTVDDVDRLAAGILSVL